MDKRLKEYLDKQIKKHQDDMEAEVSLIQMFKDAKKVAASKEKEVSPTPRSWRMRKAEWLEMNEFAKKILEGEITIINDDGGSDNENV